MSSETSEINFNSFIDRIFDVARLSALLFPKTIGADDTKTDLVKQIIKYDLAVSQDVVTGEGPPHIFIRMSDNPIVSDVPAGRDERDIKGPREVELEFWAVCVVNETNFNTSQQSSYAITNALSETLNKNKRLLDSGGLNPLCRELSLITTPFTNLQSDTKTVFGQTVIIRPKVQVNLRTVT